MQESLDKLLSIASDGLGAAKLGTDPLSFEGWDTSELRELLALRNGFYAFESALHVLPMKSDQVMDIDRWNAPSLWKTAYGGAADTLLCFAENAFGEQFALSALGVVQFDPEDPVVVPIAETIEQWADLVLDDFEGLTAWSLAHEWQVRHGPLPPGRRLVPVIPFVLGGEFTVENLIALDATDGMRLRAAMWRESRDLPIGSTVTIQLAKEPPE